MYKASKMLAPKNETTVVVYITRLKAFHNVVMFFFSFLFDILFMRKIRSSVDLLKINKYKSIYITIASLRFFFVLNIKVEDFGLKGSRCCL